MELQKSDFTTLKHIPAEHRNTLIELVKDIKIKKSEQINKSITNNTIIAFRNGMIALANVLIDAMKTEQHVEQNATLLTRQRVESKKKGRTTARINTKTKKTK